MLEWRRRPEPSALIAQFAPETLGLKALAYLAASDALNRFLQLSGADVASLRRRAAEPELLAAVLDFLLTDDGLLTQFCEKESLEPKTVHLAAARLRI